MRRGEIWMARLPGEGVGSEQFGQRPCLIVQNNVGNMYSPTTIIACLTSRMGKTELPTHVKLHRHATGLKEDSLVLCEQLMTLDKTRLLEKIGQVVEGPMKEVDIAIQISIGLREVPRE